MRIRLSLLAAGLIAAAVPAAAQVSVNINLPGLVQMAPPPPRYEPMPGPRPGQVWVPGHWQWNDRAYVWRGGHWQAARPDQAYAPGRWVAADGGWRWREGGWQRAERPRRPHDDRREWEEERHHGHDRDDEGQRGHCPPGQAKKGRC